MSLIRNKCRLRSSLLCVYFGPLFHSAPHGTARCRCFSTGTTSVPRVTILGPAQPSWRHDGGVAKCSALIGSTFWRKFRGGASGSVWATHLTFSFKMTSDKNRQRFKIQIQEWTNKVDTFPTILAAGDETGCHYMNISEKTVKNGYTTQICVKVKSDVSLRQWIVSFSRRDLLRDLSHMYNICLNWSEGHDWVLNLANLSPRKFTWGWGDSAHLLQRLFDQNAVRNNRFFLPQSYLWLRD